MSANPLANLTQEQLALRPATSPPEGVIPSLENPHSDGSKLIIAGAFLMALMYIFAGVRFYMKVFIRKKITADDCKAMTLLLASTKSKII